MRNKVASRRLNPLLTAQRDINALSGSKFEFDTIAPYVGKNVLVGTWIYSI